MTPHRRQALLLLVLACLLGNCVCSPNGNAFLSSGNMKDDDVEEDIPSFAARYTPLLARSNELVEMLRQNQLKELYEKDFDDSLKKSVSEPDFEKLYQSVTAKFGAFRSYKPRQWKFIPHTAPSRSFVTSAKIVHHDRATLYYGFTFADASSTRIIGLHFDVRRSGTGGAR